MTELTTAPAPTSIGALRLRMALLALEAGGMMMAESGLASMQSPAPSGKVLPSLPFSLETPGFTLAKPRSRPAQNTLSIFTFALD